MRLDLATWPEVEAYLGVSNGIIIPAGSTEQHGPMGLIGTDAVCAERVAMGAADLAGAMVAPTLAYAPAPFNMAFPGTISPPEKLPAGYVERHAGDRHGPPGAHRRRFPDGRVGSHSALATPEHGGTLLDTAAAAVAEDYGRFVAEHGPGDDGTPVVTIRGPDEG